MSSTPGKLKKRPTINQVARDAGVSKTSVSRFLGKDSSLLSESMRQRIELSVKRLGFQPDRIASSLRGRRTRLIGMVVADITNPFTVQIMHSIEQSCRLRGYMLMVCNTDRNIETEAEHLQVLQSYNVEGLIVHTQGTPSQVLANLVDEGMPLVLVDRAIKGIDAPCIALDNTQAMAIGMQHLQDQGFSDVLYISEPIGDVSSRQQRADAFAVELAAMAGRMRGEQREFHLDQQAEALGETLRAFQQRASKGCVVCANAPVTLGVTSALEKMGLLGQLGVLAFDEEPWSPLIGGGISTLAQPTRDMGNAAVERLCRNIGKDDGNTAAQGFVPELFPRRSTLSVSPA